MKNSSLKAAHTGDLRFSAQNSDRKSMILALGYDFDWPSWGPIFRSLRNWTSIRWSSALTDSAPLMPGLF